MRTLASEVLKVLTVFLAFFLLQNQIFEIRSDVQGRTRGLAIAQAETSSELGDTRESVEALVETSSREIGEARDELQRTVDEIRSEKEQLRRLLDRRAAEVETQVLARLENETKRLSSLSAIAESNSTSIESLKSVFEKNSSRMKRKMILPTVQLRGHGTVGSGVLIYSEKQPVEDGETDDGIYATFVITASHVVQEVVGETPEIGQRVDEVRTLREDDEFDTFSGRVVLFDRDRDIALLQLETTSRMEWLADLSSRDELQRLDVFSPAYAVGCPLGNRPMPTLGEVSSTRKLVGDQTFWMLNAPTFFGNSGGGVYELPGLRLIGVSSMIYTYGKRNPAVVPHMGLFVPLATVYDWLEDAGLGFVAAREPVPEELQEALVLRISSPGARSAAADAHESVAPASATPSR